VFTCSDTKITRTELENMAIPLSTGIQDHKVVTQSEWIASRKELLLQEKEFTKLRDELGRQRREPSALNGISGRRDLLAFRHHLCILDWLGVPVLCG
jgi:hypothetical protein